MTIVSVINSIFFVLDAALATLFAVVYVLNIFKKKTLLEPFGAYNCTGFSAGGALFFSFLTAWSYVVDTSANQGLSAGAVMNLFIIAIIIFTIISEKIINWFKNIPET